MGDEKKVNQIGKTFRVHRRAQKGIQIIIDGKTSEGERSIEY
jgi:hypothetical protein